MPITVATKPCWGKKQAKTEQTRNPLLRTQTNTAHRTEEYEEGPIMLTYLSGFLASNENGKPILACFHGWYCCV
jgi:hypothetical protein